MIGRILFLIFFIVALLEVGVFILVGEAIGLWATLLLILITAVLGAALLKREGLATWRAARARLDRGEAPLGELLEGIALLIAGALLLTPGFVTDALGFALFIPAVRRRLGSRLAGFFARSRASDARFYYHEARTQRGGPGIIDAEAVVVVDEHTAGKTGQGDERNLS